MGTARIDWCIMHEIYHNITQLCLRESFCNVYSNDRNLIGSDGVLDDHLLSQLFSPDLPVWLNSSHSASDDAEALDAQLFRTTLLRITHCHGCHASFGFKKKKPQQQQNDWSLHVIVHRFSHHSTTMIKLMKFHLKCGWKQLLLLITNYFYSFNNSQMCKFSLKRIRFRISYSIIFSCYWIIIILFTSNSVFWPRFVF